VNTSSRRMRRKRGRPLADDSRYAHRLRVGPILMLLHSKQKTRRRSEASEQRRLFHPKRMLRQMSRRRERSGRGVRRRISSGASHSSPHKIAFLLYYLMFEYTLRTFFTSQNASAGSGKYKHCVLFPTTTQVVEEDDAT